MYAVGRTPWSAAGPLASPLGFTPSVSHAACNFTDLAKLRFRYHRARTQFMFDVGTDPTSGSRPG